MPLLREVASESRRIVEFGVKHGNSTIAFLASGPETLDSYDLMKMPAVDDIKAITKGLKKEAKSDKPRKPKDYIGVYKKISYNIRAERDAFVNGFIALDGIKEIMQLIEES